MSMLQSAISPHSSVDRISSSSSAAGVSTTTNHAPTINQYPSDAIELKNRLLASYLCDVLGLGPEETEEDLDQQVQAQARAIGLELALYTYENENSKDTAATRQAWERNGLRRSQESLVSRSSQSTGFVSNFSDTSRGRYMREDYHGRKTASIASYRSYGAREYDGTTERDIDSPRQSFSFTPPTTPSRSTFSLPLSSPSPSSSPKRHFRRIRGLSILKLGRSASRSSHGDDRSYSRGSLSLNEQQSDTHIRHGHEIPTTMSRREPTDSVKGADLDVSNGHIQSVPGSFAEGAAAPDGPGEWADRMDRWDDASSQTASFVSERKDPRAPHANAFTPFKRSDSRGSKIDSVMPVSVHEPEALLQREDYRHMRCQQNEDYARFTKWLDSQHSQLRSQQLSEKRTMQRQHDIAIDQLIDQQGHAMNEAEDKQVKAEATMRENHEREKGDNAVALKHMLAYCNGTYSSGESHGRQVTDQDRAELAKTQRTRELMDSRHASAINVLRGEQSRRIRLRGMRQEKELQDLQRVFDAEDARRDFSHARHVRTLDDFAYTKRVRMQYRWRLQSAILVRNIESEAGTVVKDVIPETQWLPKEVALLPQSDAPAEPVHS